MARYKEMFRPCVTLTGFPTNFRLLTGDHRILVMVTAVTDAGCSDVRNAEITLCVLPPSNRDQ
jgi:hypothetical protein